MLLCQLIFLVLVGIFPHVVLWGFFHLFYFWEVVEGFKRVISWVLFSVDGCGFLLCLSPLILNLSKSFLWFLFNFLLGGGGAVSKKVSMFMAFSDI
jgi:hypothetical protein